MTAPRHPRRIVRASGARLGRATVWVGPGSPWDNPWRARQIEHHVHMAMKAMHVLVNNPRVIHAGTLLCGPRPPDARELAFAQSRLYQVWIENRIDQQRSDIQAQMRFAIAGVGRDAPIGPPPTIEAIRDALRGRNLADIAPARHASHAGVLLELANAEEP